VFFFLQHTVISADLAVDVRQQLHRETVLVQKSAVAQAIVHADADDDCVKTREVLLQIAELDRLERATRGVVARIKIKHDGFLVVKTGEADRFHFGVRQIETRGRLTGLQLQRSAFSLHSHGFIVAKYRLCQYGGRHD
jgi:hypothetical protein